jgi:hypothetical protein
MTPVFLHKPADVFSRTYNDTSVIKTDVTDLQPGDVIIDDELLMNTREGFGIVRSHRPMVGYPKQEMVYFTGGAREPFGTPQVLTVWRPVFDASITGPIVRAARKHGIELYPRDIQIIKGEPTIDGMDASEWLDAVTMD